MSSDVVVKLRYISEGKQKTERSANEVFAICSGYYRTRSPKKLRHKRLVVPQINFETFGVGGYGLTESGLEQYSTTVT